MGTLEGFGFKIYRLREAKEANEYIIYNIGENRVNTYSKARTTAILINELRKLKINLKEFIREEFRLGEDKTLKNKDVSAYMTALIDRELNLIDNLAFRPINKKIFVHNDKMFFNTYREPEMMCKESYVLNNCPSFEITIEKCPYIYKLLKNLHGNDNLAIKDTLYKLAHKIQNPSIKSQDCLVFYPGEGAGKGIFYKYIIAPIFGKYAKKVLMNKLKSDFNGFLSETLFLIFEEGKRDLELVEILKEVITEGEVLINEKHKATEMKEIYFISSIFSNHMNPADLGKRRGSYHQCNSLGKTIEESQKIGAEMCENIPNELKELLYYLHNLEVEDQKAMMPFNTLAKVQVNDLNKNAIELFFDFLIQYPDLKNAFGALHRRRYEDRMYNFITEEYKDEKYVSKDIFREAYNNFCFNEGLRNNIITHNKYIVQLWALLKVPAEAHQRIIIKDGVNAGRRLSHVRLKDINETIKEEYKQNGSN